MPRDGPKAVPDGKGPVSPNEKKKTVDISAVIELLQILDRQLEERDKKFDRHFEEMDRRAQERAKSSREPLKGAARDAAVTPSSKSGSVWRED